MTIQPTEKLALPDLKVGVPTLMLCIEFFVMSILHTFAFPWQPYKIPPRSMDNGDYLNVEKHGGLLGILAFIDALNVWDLFKAFGRAVRWLFVGRRYREKDPSYNLVSKFITPHNDILGTTSRKQPPRGGCFEASEFDQESRPLFDSVQMKPVTTLM
jgi:hypothetical protein